MNPENIYYVPTLVTRILQYPLFKLAVGISLFFLHFFFDSLNTSATIAVFALIFMDSITGVMAAFRTGTAIESHKLLRTAIKIAVYSLMISAGFLSEKAIPIHGIDETIIAALAVTELFSILENTARAGYTVAARLLDRFNKNLEAQ
jgi:phage-related holin